MNSSNAVMFVLFGLWIFSVQTTLAQFEIDEPILLSSPNEEDRQVKGLGYPEENENAVSALVILNASIIYDEATGSDQILVDLDPAIDSYSAGLLITFAPDISNNGAVTINVNGNGPVSINKNIDQDLDSADLRPNIPMTIIYDGTDFQLIGQYSSSCPEGYIEMTRDYCIEALPQIQTSFWAAIQICSQAGARLCSFGEWHYACRTDQDFFNSVLDYEWIDHAANHNDRAKRIGVDLAGNTDCYSGAHQLPQALNYFRCCYTK